MLKKASVCLVAVCLVMSWMGSASGRGKKASNKSKGSKEARQEKQVKVAILPVKVGGLPLKVGNELGTVVINELMDIGVFTVIPGNVTYSRLQQLKKKDVFVPDCTERPECVRAVGQDLEVRVIYHMLVAKSGKSVTLSMHTFDVKSGQQVREGKESATEDPGDLERAARWVTRNVSGPMITVLDKGKGKLQVECNDATADLYINHKLFGKRIGKSFKVSTGVFDIQVKQEGFVPFHDVVVLKSGQMKVVNAALARVPEPKPVEVAVVPIPKPAGPPGEASLPPPKTAGVKPDAPKGEKVADKLPDWAAYQQPKPPQGEEPKKADGQAAGKKPGETFAAWEETSKRKPYLPSNEEPVTLSRRKSREGKFYQTWWFWTLVGVVAVGAGGAAAYFTLFSGPGGNGGAGSALVQWE